MLYFSTVRALVNGKRASQIPWGTVAYITSLLVGCTIYFVGDIRWTQEMFIDYRGYPGGPLGFYNNAYTTPMIVLGNAAYL